MPDLALRKSVLSTQKDTMDNLELKVRLEQLQMKKILKMSREASQMKQQQQNAKSRKRRAPGGLVGGFVCVY